MDKFFQRSETLTPRTPLAAASPNLPMKSPQRAAKRRKLEDTEIEKHEDQEDFTGSYRTRNIQGLKGFESIVENEVPGDDDGDEEKQEEGAVPCAHTETAFESSLPPVNTDKKAIEAYESMRASQLSQEQEVKDDAATRRDSRQWIRRKSSIYVDAFNLALDTVLEEELYLFDERERRVFEAWKSLDYEAQYLYVRLFLRKAATWHRIGRLGYYGDISDLNQAISTLMELRGLPETEAESHRLEDDGGTSGTAEWSLPDRFTFLDDSESGIKAIDEAAALLSLEELKTLAKEAKVQGKNKADLLKGFCRMSAQQMGLLSLGFKRANSRDSVDVSNRDPSPSKQDLSRNTHYLGKILTLTGPLIRLSAPIFRLFERVHLVFYRSTEWTEKSLTTIILAKISRRNFPEYLICRSRNIFPSRAHLLEFERSVRREFDVDQLLEFSGPPGEKGFRAVLGIFNGIAARWRALLAEEQSKEDKHVYEFGEGVYLRRFSAAHAYTRIAHKAAYVLGRLHEYEDEHALLSELLSQRLFNPARRGAWYQRKALIEERYMWQTCPGTSMCSEPDAQKTAWARIAAATCEAGLQDNQCHLIYHYDLQKRLLKLEKRLNVPRRHQHDFRHVRLKEPEQHTVRGVQLVRGDSRYLRGKAGRGASTKTTWLDVEGEDAAAHVSVEAMCLSHYRSQGWKGYHSEGGILRTLFALLFYDVLFLYVPNVFQTAYQTCPLDLHTDGFFYSARTSEINRRLAEIGNGEARRLIKDVYERECERQTCVCGLNWDFELEDLLELVGCFEGEALAAICKVMAQEYRARGGGVPDLVMWRVEGTADMDGEAGEQRKGDVMFAEVKSANDRPSDTQRLWIHVLSGAGVRVALCHAVARETRVV